MIILSCGAGMQSTALALMSCEKKKKRQEEQQKNQYEGQIGIYSLSSYDGIYPHVPVYDAIIFCDLGNEPPWVYEQVEFIRNACKDVNIPFYVLNTNLYDDYITKFGQSRVVSIPFWTIGEDGAKAKLRRNCTVDKKIVAIHNFARWELLGYKKGTRTKPEDIQAHEMHIGFSAEEKRRCNESQNPLFINKYPLVEMGAERADSYKYILEKWGLKSKASACGICPFHTNYYFAFIKKNYPELYAAAVTVDNLLAEKQHLTPIRSQVFISRSRKRLTELTDEDCNDAQYFTYNGVPVWNGF